ncbi:hypothetical protein [Nesterenkonia sphaerica]|uniref:Uncharacterized protein n=1 Tax=Nesterenkonia sphaerica TaxID=1804988 RepID=A0A5R9A2L8_9MICC|nr:hypothetical protein [Nesterenkonia sphaerica]TLP72951.1 hypothetical protein FEF27_11015 [Nesterenkonia sphaerica]
MTENLTTETHTQAEAATEDPPTFDLNRWLGEGKRHTRTLTVYLDPGLLGEAQELQERIKAHNKGASLQDPQEAAQQAAELQEQQAELEARIRASKAEVTVEALSDTDAEAFAAEYAQVEKNSTRQWDQSIVGTCIALAKLGTIGGERLTADQWHKLSQGPLAGGQWARIKQTILLASQETPDRLTTRRIVTPEGAPEGGGEASEAASQE